MIDAPAVTIPPGPRQEALRRAAQEMEAAFLAEMLKPMGANMQSASFGGGIGEAQFSSFLAGEQAKLMVRAGGIGLSESIFNALAAGSHASSS